MDKFKKFAYPIFKALKPYCTGIYLGIGDLDDTCAYNQGWNIIAIGESFLEKEFDYACVALLHEAGHAIVTNEGLSEASFDEWIDMNTNQTITDNIQTEEVLAWIFAESLMEDLNIKISKKYFYKIRKESLLEGYDLKI